MEYVNLGKTGLKVSRICLGCMTYGSPATGKLLPGRQPGRLNEEDSQPFFRQALDLGINFFDTANVYSGGDSEVGAWPLSKANTRREAVVIATKVHGVMREEPNGRGLSRKAILFELDESLRRLETDYVDLYQIHRWDYETPIEETLEALHDVVKAGKVRYIGASSMYAWQFAKALYLADLHWMDALRFHAESLQPALSRRRARDDGPLPVRGNRRHSLEPPRAWPADTRLEGRDTNRSETDEFGKSMYSQTEEADRKVVDRLGEIAEKRGIPRAQIALAWLLAKPGVTSPIVGASKPHHLDDAVAALAVKLTPEEMKALEEPYVPHPVLGFS